MIPHLSSPSSSETEAHCLAFVHIIWYKLKSNPGPSSLQTTSASWSFGCQRAYGGNPHSPELLALLNIYPLNRNTLIPAILQQPRHLLRRLMTHHCRDQVQTRIQPARDSPTRNNPQPTQPQTRPPRIALPPLDTLLPRITPLARNALPPPIGPLGQDKRILLLILAQLEPRIIDHVILLHDIRLLQIPAPRRILANNLHLGVEIRVRGRGHALQHARGAQDQTAGADGHQRALFGRVRGLQLGEGFEQRDGFGVGGDDGVDPFRGAAGHDQHVVFFEVVVRVRVIDISLDGQA